MNSDLCSFVPTARYAFIFAISSPSRLGYCNNANLLSSQLGSSSTTQSLTQAHNWRRSLSTMIAIRFPNSQMSDEFVECAKVERCPLFIYLFMFAYQLYGFSSSFDSCSSNTQTLTSPSSPVLRITSSPSLFPLSALSAQTT